MLISGACGMHIPSGKGDYCYKPYASFFPHSLVRSILRAHELACTLVTLDPLVGTPVVALGAISHCSFAISFSSVARHIMSKVACFRDTYPSHRIGMDL